MQQPIAVQRRPHRPYVQPHAPARDVPHAQVSPMSPMPLKPQMPPTPQHQAGPPPPPQQPAPLPQGSLLVNRYYIEDYIGGGGFAHIYLARDLAFGHRRAIKEAFYRDPQTRHQFRFEAEFLLNMHHPNLVRGYACFEHAGRQYLVMEYVDGQTLEDVVIDHIRRTGRVIAEAQILDWMIPICEAVHALHIQPVPIIHRDIKPANIKLSREKGVPVLIDLGLAKLYNRGQQTIAAALAFTPGYAPPEQYSATGATDQRTDVYALGASLFFLLTGYQPTESPARFSAQSLPAPRMLNPRLSAQAEAIVLKAMALNPLERYQTAAELASDLRMARAALGVPRVYQASGAGTSGGPASLLPCPQCGTPHPLSARFCMRCGNSLTPDSGPSAALRGDAPATSVIVQKIPALTPRPVSPATPQLVEQTTRVGRPTPLLAPASPLGIPGQSPALGPIARPMEASKLQGTGRAAMAVPWPGRWQTQPLFEVQAWASVLALLALVCISLSLTSAFLPWMLVFILPGLALGHWVVGFRVFEWTPWRAMPAPREFRLLAKGALGLGYFWLLIEVLMWLARVAPFLVGRH
jgi:serine/threonine protein kinase